MSLIRSKLFWKIAGLYVLLSVPALVGLVAALQTRLYADAMLLHEQQLESVLRDSAGRLSVQRGPGAAGDELLRIRAGLTGGRRVWLSDGRGGDVAGLVQPEFGDAALASILRTTLAAGTAKRHVRPQWESGEVLATGQRFQLSGVEWCLVMTSPTAVVAESSRQMSVLLVKSAAAAWLIGTLCMGIVAGTIVSPLRVMSKKLHGDVRRDDRGDMLLNVSDRGDEVGDVASALYRLEDELQDRIYSLERAGREAGASVDLLTAVLESMIEGVIAIDREQKLVFVNPGARRLLSIGAAIQAGHRLYEAVRIPAFLETVEESLAAGRMQTLEYRAPRENSHHLLTVIPILRGPHAGAVIVVRDVSEVRQLEAMRRDFVSGVSHELKTPLTVIQACTETLLNGALEDGEVARRFLGQIDEQAERLLQLILAMLQLARVESGSEILHVEDLELADLADDAVDAFRTVAENRGVHLGRLGVASLAVRADEQAVRTILSNLVDNAIKHTPAGGEVLVELRASADGPTLVVRDTGSGIPEELLGRIFERFYRVEKDRSRERGGSGLGLAIVKHLCQALQANLTVRSRVNEGSEFTVRFSRV
ncbi:MAG: ATP-binding protein [Planctomycetaceae bacterium]